ncbi:ABC transporter ATP-binding protein [Nocardia huaxiensis]|uniref:ABC transporter ATP-binding protein n=1 Tax=Nocardia huaxiensis TaxID=2755382 RepID=A0A7D6ZH72_9NOCA|nr:ABC transporter ATP-binding protein [Nocardia huaxiensis]QLY27903.1 ABC transporter ATP-binding protein [Nocardia huaxiensis]
MITVHDVGFDYDGKAVLAEIGLLAENGTTVGLIGPNGSGKSTLLRVIHRALRPRAGSVLIDDTPVTELRGRRLAAHLAVVTQDAPTDAPITVTDMVLLGRSPWASAFQGYSHADYTTAATALARVGARHLADRPFAALSGGERQRVLIARALAQQAAHLLLDEPTNHLDIHYQHELLSLVRGLDVTTLVVLHDLNLAARYCDSLILLDGGRIAAAGSVAEVLTPEVLEPVYRVRVERHHALGALHLIFGPKGIQGRDTGDPSPVSLDGRAVTGGPAVVPDPLVPDGPGNLSPAMPERPVHP